MRVIIDDVIYVPAAPVCVDKGPLEFSMFVSDLGRGATLREYLCALTTTLWKEGESFSGKRPFGNSGWEHDVYKFLVGSGAVFGVFDEEGYLEEVDTKTANALMPGLIAAAFSL